jgi:hypothetical protein
MRIRFAEFRELVDKFPDVRPTRIVRYTSARHYEMVMQGSVFSRASDKNYVLDNVQSRATHVELPQSDEHLFGLYPQLSGVVADSDINLPPGEFFLMEDLYQLPDSGSWQTGNEISAKTFQDPPSVMIPLLMSLHEGMLIDNHVINAIRRRTTYVLRGDHYVRSRDTTFRVRPRTQRVLVVLDNAEEREQVQKIVTQTPHYMVGFYVMEEEGINIRRLDHGDIEHIGIIKHIKEHKADPDVILFEPHREQQRQNTATTIMRQNARIDAKFRFRGIKCGQIDIGVSQDALHEAIMDFFDENVAGIADDEPEASRPSTKRFKPGGEIQFDVRKLMARYQQACLQMGLASEAIHKKLKEYTQNASKLALRIIGQKLLRSVHSQEKLASMSALEKKKAIANYVAEYPERITQLRTSLLQEQILKDGVLLWRRVYDANRGEQAEAEIDAAETRIHQEVLEVLRQTYDQPIPDESAEENPEAAEALSDEELMNLYGRDYQKLCNTRIIEYMASTVLQEG